MCFGLLPASLFISHFPFRLSLRVPAIVQVGCAALFFASGLTVSAETVLHLFAAGPSQRPEVLRDIVERYEREHPGIKIQVSTGAATSEMQRQYLSTLLNARDETYDALLIDIINPAEYSAAGWLEPLDDYFGSDAKSILMIFCRFNAPPIASMEKWWRCRG